MGLMSSLQETYDPFQNYSVAQEGPTRLPDSHFAFAPLEEEEFADKVLCARTPYCVATTKYQPIYTLPRTGTVLWLRFSPFFIVSFDL